MAATDEEGFVVACAGAGAVVFAVGCWLLWLWMRLGWRVRGDDGVGCGGYEEGEEEEEGRGIVLWIVGMLEEWMGMEDA